MLYLLDVSDRLIKKGWLFQEDPSVALEYRDNALDIRCLTFTNIFTYRFPDVSLPTNINSCVYILVDITSFFENSMVA